MYFVSQHSDVAYNIGFFGKKYSVRKKTFKYWGMAEVEDKLYVFWSRGNQKFTFKRYDWLDVPLVMDLVRQKSNSGYEEFTLKPEDAITSFYLKFRQDLFEARLMNLVHGEQI